MQTNTQEQAITQWLNAPGGARRYAYLAMRWGDEHQYENPVDYHTAILATLPPGAALVGAVFSLGGAKVRITVTAPQWGGMWRITGTRNGRVTVVKTL